MIMVPGDVIEPKDLAFLDLGEEVGAAGCAFVGPLFEARDAWGRADIFQPRWPRH